MEDVNKNITKRVVKELRIMGMKKGEFNKRMNKGEKWITMVEAENRDWKAVDLFNACRILDVEPSSLFHYKVNEKNICDMSIREILAIMLKDQCSTFIRNNPDRLSAIVDFIKLMGDTSKIKL